MPRGHEQPCGNECGELASGKHGIPIGRRTCDVVANDYEGEWDPMPACERCFNVHAKAGPAGLDAYLEATKDLRELLRIARDTLKGIGAQCADTLDQIGDGQETS